MKRLRVLVADDHYNMRSLIVELLDDVFHVVGAVANGAELFQTAIRLLPDVIVSDVLMPRMSGLAAREMLIAKGRAIPFVFVSALGIEVTYLLPTDCPVAFVYKQEMSSHLCKAVEAVFAGRPYLSPHYRE